MKIKVKNKNLLAVEGNKFDFLSILKGSLFALAVSLISILIFAFFIKFIVIPNTVIKPVNQVIKGLSIFIGCFLALRKSNSMGLVKGLLIGIVYTIISFLVFSILDGNFSFTTMIINDILFSSVTGAICGIMTVNFFKK